LGEGVDILDEADFFARLDIADGRGQAATAFSENRTILNQDFLRNPNTKRWHDLGRNYGFGSSASFPIRENDQPIAVLTVYRADINGFEDESVALLERLSSDISHTVTALSGVAERKRLEEALRFRQFGLDQVDEGIFWIDKDARICEANGTACRMLGYTHSELLQLTVADIDPNITLENWPEHWQALRQNKILCFESCHKIRDGLIYPTEVVANYFEYQGVEYNCALVRNISERKEAEQALLQAKTDAEAANLAKTRFLAAASHDLRQPIQAINLFQDALRQTDLNAEQKTISDFLSKSVHSLSELLYSLLDVSKLDAGQVMPQFAKVKVEDLFKAVDAEFSSLAQQKGLRFKLSYPFKDVFLVTDPRLLMSVLRNLIDNSLKYTEEGGALVGFRKRGLNGILQVWDSGVGIESRYGEQVFEECFQVSNPARDRTKGLGLGLSIARRMARLLKGDVRYQSRLGRGTVFEIVLPLAELSEVTDEAGAMPKPESVSTLGVQDRLQFSGWRVVVIEDDPMVAKSIEFSLQTRGVRVTVFHSSELALASPDIMDADFYISDFSLPGLDGIRLLDSIQQRSAAPISAVLVTGESSHERMEMASSSHWKVLLKPVEPSALLAAMSEKKVYDNRNREPCFASQTNSVLVQVAQEC